MPRRPLAPVLSRRRLLQGAGGLLAAAGVPGLALAQAPGAARFVLVLLRGGMDGLAAVPPHGDPHYRRVRASLALPGPHERDGLHDLDGHFGLHPALGPLGPLWDRGELALLPATALPYRGRSHFDAQDLLENGTATPHGAAEGWLNRALVAHGGAPAAMSFGSALPLVLQGPAPVASVDPGRDSSPPDGFVDQVAALYGDDPVLGPALAQGIAARAQVEASREAAPGDAAMAGMSAQGAGRRSARTAAALGTAGRVMGAPDGPRVAVIDSTGWDTHATQGLTNGRLARQLSTLAAGLTALRTGLGPAWDQTVVLVVSEFGRTAAPNGTRGTDHGTASMSLALGGAVQGGRALGHWPGLAPRHLHEGRDLAPALDLRAVFKGVLRDHMGLDEAVLAETVFPGSGAVAPLETLVRA